MSWKYVQRNDESGQYRTTDEGGGGGSSTFAGLDDVGFSNLQDGQVPKYNSSTGKWENDDESGGTVTDVQVDGTSVVNQQTGEANIEIPVKNVTYDGQSIVNPNTGEAEIPAYPTPNYPVVNVKVNGTSVVDANKEAQIKSYKEVTQSEYNALPDSKLNDDVMYCIKDVGGADSFPPLIYSDEEREIGVWRDGKPLYQKTINFGNLPNAEGKDVAHGISNLDRIVAYSAVTKNSDGTTYLPMPRVSDQSQYINDIYFTNEYIHIHSMTDRSTHNVFVTLQYTKTTDIAGSGIWTTQGGFAHHYSMDEKIIGTWIDGKPLYERIIRDTRSGGFLEGEYTILSGASTYHLIPDGLMGMLSISNGVSQYSVPWAKTGNSANSTSLYKSSSGNINLIVRNDNYASYYLEVTMRYTKTTD